MGFSLTQILEEKSLQILYHTFIYIRVAHVIAQIERQILKSKLFFFALRFKSLSIDSLVIDEAHPIPKRT